MSVKVASIWIFPIVREYPRFQPTNRFEIPAVERNAEPAVITVEDQYETNKMPGLRQWKDELFPATQIAHDIVLHATRGGPHMLVGAGPYDPGPRGAHPGVWIAGENLKQERSWAMEVQTNYCITLVEEGNGLAGDPASRKAIKDIHRKAALWLGRKPEWLNVVDDVDMKSCQFCSSLIAASAIVCPKCSQVIDYDRYAAEEAKKQAALNRALKTGAPVKAPLQEVRT